jgi:hypothetical protein
LITKIEYFSAPNVQKDLDVLRKLMQQTNDRIVTLEKLLINSHIILENISTMIPKQDNLERETKKNFVHINSRVSPYVYTNYSRFPVLDKFVPWEVTFNIIIYPPKIWLVNLDFIRSL